MASIRIGVLNGKNSAINKVQDAKDVTITFDKSEKVTWQCSYCKTITNTTGIEPTLAEINKNVPIPAGGTCTSHMLSHGSTTLYILILINFNI